MPDTLTEVKDADQEFFRAVIVEPVLLSVLNSLGFTPPQIAAAQHNALLILTRPTWTLPLPIQHPRTLNIHFEARRQNELRLEVGPEPYIGRLDKKPEIRREMVPVLVRRAYLIDALRERLLNARDLPQDIDVNSRNLLRSEATAAHTIVKFTGGLAANPPPSQAALFFARVVEAVTPVVDGVLADMKAK